ncbi:hypothetical protein FRC03_009574 [Tulasnella sp. 419]|nr:hypothetical protein FRC03_009574 [Tulasnella sp. 419]
MEDLIDVRDPEEGVTNGTNGSTNQYGEFYNPTRQQLKRLVLSYLCHQCYTSTAEVFAKSKDIQTRLEEAARRRQKTDGDGDAVMGNGTETPESTPSLSKETLATIAIRKEIIDCLLNGKIEEARQLVNRHFPSVLNTSLSNSSINHSDSSTSTSATGLMLSASNPPMADNNSCRVSLKPEHLNLNLRIQTFIESVRTKPLSPSSSTETSSPNSCSGSPPRTLTPNPKKALALAQQLYMEVSAIESSKDRNDYMQEVNNVGGLMAYKVPEQSPIAAYLSMKRREAVAEQINSAIMGELEPRK